MPPFLIRLRLLTLLFAEVYEIMSLNCSFLDSESGVNGPKYSKSAF